MRINPESLARSSSRRPKLVLLLWIIGALAMGFLSFAWLGDVLTQSFDFANRPESVQALEVLEEKFGDQASAGPSAVALVYNESLSVKDPPFVAVLTQLQQRLASLDGVVAQKPFIYPEVALIAPEQAAAMVSQDRHATLMQLDLEATDDEAVASIREVAAEFSHDGFVVEVAGEPMMNVDFTQLAEEDLRRGESIGVAAALVILVMVFAALMAAILPVVLGVVAILVALGIVAIIGQWAELSIFVTNMISMIGLAVGIDYSLFIVSRFREERANGNDKLEAIAIAGATANRAVFFSGMTVVLALVGMFIVPASLFRSLATGAIVVTVVAVGASLTLLPALLALLGDRIDWPRKRRRHVARSESTFWTRLAQLVMRFPVAFLLAAVAVLGYLGSFYLDLRVGTAQSVSALPDGLESKAAFIALERFFAGGLTDPARIVVTADPGDLAPLVEATRAALAANPALAPVTTASFALDATAAEVLAYFRGDPASDASFVVVRELRTETVPELLIPYEGAEILVGGNTAFLTDFLDMTQDYQWVVLAFVLVLSFILLMIVFRSIVVPFKAILMNLLSVLAAYGAITLVFQKGVGIEFFNSIGFRFRQVEAIESWIPLFLFSVLFGLSMDYHVFLLSRIREYYDKTGDNTASVAHGLSSTARIITGAALIMVAVFVGFASGRLGQLQQMGFGLAVAVLADATIVRMLIIPASMRLLGGLNWYLPRWLNWLPRLQLERSEPERDRIRV